MGSYSRKSCEYWPPIDALLAFSEDRWPTVRQRSGWCRHSPSSKAKPTQCTAGSGSASRTTSSPRPTVRLRSARRPGEGPTRWKCCRLQPSRVAVFNQIGPGYEIAPVLTDRGFSPYGWILLVRIALVAFSSPTVNGLSNQPWSVPSLSFTTATSVLSIYLFPDTS